MIQDVLDGLKLVADGINSVKEIAEAVKSGKDYLKTNHREVQSDLRAMLDELRKNIDVITSASAVLTHFSFAVSTDVMGSELVRFNIYFIDSKAKAQELRDHIEDLRTHCSKVRDHAKKISGSVDAAGFRKIFELLGLHSPEREKELGDKLDKLAYGDFAVANSAEMMLHCLEWALKDVQNALGVAGSMYPENIPQACALLNAYGREFETMEESAAGAVKDVRELANELK